MGSLTHKAARTAAGIGIDQTLKKVTHGDREAELEKLIAEVSNIHVADRIYDYIAELVDLTRSNAYVTLGVSPRGALAVTRAAKANAYLEGRDYVIPDDVCAVFPDVCVHRLILNSKARLQDYTAALILQNVLTSVQKPDVREFSSK